MLNAQINGIPCVLFYEARIPSEKAPIGYPHMYHVRHDENNWTCPTSIERFVAVNFFGTIFTKTPFEFGTDDYIEIEQFELENNYVEFRVSGKLFKKMLGL